MQVCRLAYTHALSEIYMSTGKLSTEEESQLNLVGIRTKAKDKAQDSSNSLRRWGMLALTTPTRACAYTATRVYRSIREVV